MSKQPSNNKDSDKKSEQCDSLQLNQFFNYSDLLVESTEVIDSDIYLYLKSFNSFGICPYCSQINHQVHSTYVRTLVDLPVFGRKVVLRFNARKFFCKNDSCSKRTFAEQPGEICRYRRRTKRCEELISTLSINMSSPTASHSLRFMQIPISSSTVLRTIYHIEMPQLADVAELGVDDWAFRKGVTYGSILVDLQTKNVIDLLGDRQTARKYIAYDNLPPRKSHVRNDYYKYDRYVEQEYTNGKSFRQIHKEIKSKGFKGSFSPFHYHYKYLSDEKMENKSGKIKTKPVDNREPLIPIKVISIITFKSIKGYSLNNQAIKLIDTLMTFDWFQEIYNAAKSFYQIIMGTDSNKLTGWISQYQNTTIAKLKTFIKGIVLDRKAVQNAITYNTSNGIVEGFVNKLKTIKRIMYGRASLDLLKRKMILTNKSIQLM